MSGLPEEFLRYPMRRHGMDHDLYPYSNLFARPPVAWPGDKPVALSIVVPLQWFPLNSDNKPFRPPGGMLTPYPDLRHYSSRDYGNRVAVVRLLELFEQLDLRVTFAANAALTEGHGSLLQTIAGAGHEIAAHGLDMNHLHHGGLAPDEERERIAQTLRRLADAGLGPVRGWLSPARSQSDNTPALLAEAGLEYCLDWVNDDMPYAMLDGGLVCMPHSEELCDRQIILDYRHGEDSFVQQVQDAHRCLHKEAGRHGGRVLSLSLYPWVSGLPYRIGYLERALRGVLEGGQVWCATSAQLLDSWRGQAAG